MKDMKITNYIKYRNKYTYENPEFYSFDETKFRVEHMPTNGHNVRKIYGHYVESGMAYLFSIKNDNN